MRLEQHCVLHRAGVADSSLPPQISLPDNEPFGAIIVTPARMDFGELDGIMQTVLSPTVESTRIEGSVFGSNSWCFLSQPPATLCSRLLPNPVARATELLLRGDGPRLQIWLLRTQDVPNI